jgi:secondary thiamine-phosphate synthase enzyme
MHIHTGSFTIATSERTEVADVTKRVLDVVQHCPLRDGIVVVNTLHTTCALFVNEFQAALVHDVRKLAEHLVPEGAGYRHDDPRYSDCDRHNAHAHLRTMLLGRSITLGLAAGALALGQFQSIIFAEFDGPRQRGITVQVLGT